MDRDSLDRFKKKLLEEKEKALKTAELLEKNDFNDSLQNYTHEMSLYDNHPADIGTETYEMEKNFALEENIVHRLREIEQALERIEKGEYGKCTLCGKDIDMERLEAYPEADTCRECSRGTRIPFDRIMEGRPVEEDVLNYPYNREYSDEDEQTIFDGEDSWQAVARYNRREDDPSNQTADHQGFWDENPSGVVEKVDRISNKYYKGQLPGEEREDID